MPPPRQPVTNPYTNGFNNLLGSATEAARAYVQIKAAIDGPATPAAPAPTPIIITGGGAGGDNIMSRLLSFIPQGARDDLASAAESQYLQDLQRRASAAGGDISKVLLLGLIGAGVIYVVRKSK